MAIFDFLPWIIAGVLALGGALLGLRSGRGSKHKADAKRAQDHIMRADAGRAEVEKAKRSGKTPEEIARENDGEWQ